MDKEKLISRSLDIMESVKMIVGSHGEDVPEGEKSMLDSIIDKLNTDKDFNNLTEIEFKYVRASYDAIYDKEEKIEWEEIYKK
ncbi:hypothetical protein Bp8pS_260 [Bacillus phage vB_BpuM-BpSp]|nr:hypothetical protein Bp8pS_260 [Bacillus phage vB_BpuM-BpSp]